MLILDGGMGTELEKRGIDTSDPLWLQLWSAKFLLPVNTEFQDYVKEQAFSSDWNVKQLNEFNKALSEHPEWLEGKDDDSNLLYLIHEEYLWAGADVITSASYQGSLEGLLKAGAIETWPEALWLLRKSEQLVHKAISNAGVSRKVLLAASVGPFGAWLGEGQEYSGDYSGYDQDSIKRHHEFKIRGLLGGKPDILLIETVPSKQEVEGLVEVLNDIMDGSSTPVALSLSVKSEGGQAMLADSSSLQSVVESVAGCPYITYIGVNCCADTVAREALAELQKHTKLQLIVYPNSGEIYDGNTKMWSGDSSSAFLSPAVVAEWLSSASIIGGCCRTGPSHISFLNAKRIKYGQ